MKYQYPTFSMAALHGAKLTQRHNAGLYEPKTCITRKTPMPVSRHPFSVCTRDFNPTHNYPYLSHPILSTINITKSTMYTLALSPHLSRNVDMPLRTQGMKIRLTDGSVISSIELGHCGDRVSCYTQFGFSKSTQDMFLIWDQGHSSHYRGAVCGLAPTTGD